MTNPLLTSADLPSYAAIQPEHVEPAIDHLLAANRADLERLLAANAVYTWDNLIRPLEALEDRLNKAWSPVNHLHSVRDSETLRAAYNACLPKLSAYYSELGQHQGLYRAYQQIADGPEYARLDRGATQGHRRRPARFPAVRHRPAARATGPLPGHSCGNWRNLAPNSRKTCWTPPRAWTERSDRRITQLAGLPDSARALARQTAQQRGLDGWLLTLELPSYLPVLNYADDRQLRRELYDAYCTRASDQGPNAASGTTGR